MKLFAAILSLHFLALNLVPCGDEVQISSYDTIEFKVDSDHEQGHGDCGLCSPFCHCHCCHVHIIDFGNTKFEPFQQTLFQDNFVHRDSLGKKTPYSIFQPPRV